MAMLETGYCRARQKRLLERMAGRGLDAVVVGGSHHVYYFTGHRTFWQQQSAAVVFGDGRVFLVTANEPAGGVAADEVVSYAASWMGTQRQEQAGVVAEAVKGALVKRKASAIGIDASAANAEVGLRVGGGLESMEGELAHLRRRKDPDELELMLRAVRCCEAMYARAREIIEPGVPELHVYGELHAAGVKAAGEPLSGMLGNDYACGCGGGPPRSGRVAQAGELYILDLGPAFRGYFSDNARTIAVDGRPSGAQEKAWEVVMHCHGIVREMARPGARCREIFEAVDEYLRLKVGCGMVHHLGHGVGLQPHEYPHLNPGWDDVLMEGEFFTAEPGVYSELLGGGIRIEENYVVTAGGVRQVLNSPAGL